MKVGATLFSLLLLGITSSQLTAASEIENGLSGVAPAPRCEADLETEDTPDEPLAAGSRLQIVRAAAPQPAILSFPKGAALLRGDKPVPTAAKGTALRPGDILQNGPAGSLDFRLGDLATLRLEPGAKLQLSTLLRQRPGLASVRDTALRLDVGTALVRLRGARDGARFVIETPNAVVAGDGSAFQLRVGKPGTSVMVHEGRVAINSATERAPELALDAKEKVQIQKLLPEKSDPCDEGDQPRQDAMRQFAESIDLETEPLLAAIDAHLMGGRLLDAERQADYVVGRAWGRPNAVRAHARYLESVRRRLGTVHLAGFELMGFDQTSLAWYRGLPEAHEKSLQAALQGGFRTDPVALRWALVWSAVLHSQSGPVDTMPDRVLLVAEAEGADDLVRTECMALAGLAIQDRNERGRTEDLLRQATVLLEAVLLDPKCDPVLQMKASARLLFWPESRAQRTAAQRRIEVDRLLAQAQKTPHGWGYYFAAGALQTLGRESEAASYIPRFFDDPLVRGELTAHPGFALPWAEQLANSLRAKGEKHHAREIWRFLSRRYQHNPQLVERASEELISIGL